MDKRVVFSKITFALLLIVAVQYRCIAQDKMERNSNWSMEYSAGGAFFRIHAAQALYKLSNHGEFMFGPCFQNYKNSQGRAHAYTLLVGYRHTFWKNVTLDYELFPAYNEFHSSIDGKVHTGFEIYSELRPGYKFNFNIGNCKMYLLPQLTIGYGIWTNNKWPDFDLQPNPAIMGNLWLGIRL